MSVNGSGSDSKLQRIAIAVGTLIVVILTVIIAIFLAFGEGTEEEPVPTETAVALASPTPTNTLLPPVATDTPPLSEPTETPIPPTATASPPPPPPTDTPTLPPPPPDTPTPQPVVDTPTTPATAAAVVGTPPRCQAPADWVQYVAVVGDTYNNLAARTGTTVADLLDVNCPQTATLRPGEVVYLPFIPPTPTPTFTPGPTSPPAATPTRTGTPIKPEIDSVTPRRVEENNEEFFMTILGKNFKTRESGFRVELRGPSTIGLQLRQPTVSEVSFDVIVPANLPIGTYDLVVTNQNGLSGIRTSALTVGPVTPTPEVLGPEITDVNPTSGVNNQDRLIEVTGRRFLPNESGFRVELRIGDDVETTLEVQGAASSTSFNVRVPAGLRADIYDLWVINPDGQEDVEPAAYEVLNP